MASHSDPAGRLRRARARPRLEAAAEPAARRLVVAPGNPGIEAMAAGAGRGRLRPPVAADDRPALLALAAARDASTWWSAGPRRRWPPGWATPSRRAGIRFFGPDPGGGRDRGLEGLRQGADGRGGRAHRGLRQLRAIWPRPRRFIDAPARRRGGQGRRAVRRQGRGGHRLARRGHGGGARRCWATRQFGDAGRPGGDRGAARRAARCR